MAQKLVPHFINDVGVDRIKTGVKEFQCMGATPPEDHPHVYLDMGHETEIICPYCSTLYIYDDKLGAKDTDPPTCYYDHKDDEAA